ncbi:GntR family transcriptional regulator [Streptacidiphilus sp. P02-A3a]|uniref:GntR family transcriptional regulator n=1 Tax=Streptacidiphilus sp. P02-A3a TaxID=2704468 RepID=UPI0015F92110|nr:GntR family transcriptional regulator [Streptacidiphilus sp. P02-A3a]QMU69741.1 GntR family transcriptional regulator [Streptacidiphilus sp. P02-A3a]
MAGEKATRAGAVHAQIREEIFHGELDPGQRLRLVELAERFGVSQSVIREALTRLSEQGLVTAAPQQGFSVIALSLKHLNELTEARTEIESMVLRRSVERGDIQWESSAVAAHHHLASTPAILPDGHVSGDWFAVHERFHQALLEGCGNDRLLAVATNLRDAAAIYRRWSRPVGHDYERNVAREHQELLDVVLSRDAAAAAELLAQHIDRTSASLRAVIHATAT